jgi:hypothetical protein
MPQLIKSEVLKFSYTSADSKINPASGQNLVQLAGTNSVDDLKLLQLAINEG